MKKSAFCKVFLGVLLIFGAPSLSAVFWGPAMEVTPVTISTTFPIALNTNDNGDSIVAWYDGNNIFTSILPITSTTAWSTPKLVEAIGAVNLIQIVVALDNNHDVAIGWKTADVSGSNHVFLSYQPSGGSFTAPFVPTLSFSSSLLSISIDNNGVPFVSWSDGTNSTTAPRIDLYFFISGTWQTDPSFPGQSVATPPAAAGTDYPPFIAGNDKGDLVALWVGPNFNQYYLSSRVSGSWSTPIVIGAEDTFGVTNAVAVNSSDQAALISRNTTNNISAGTFPLSSLPTPPGSTLLIANPFPFSIYTAINAQGNIAAVWPTTFSSSLVDGAYYNASTMLWTLTDPIGIDPNTINSFLELNTVVSIDPANNAPAVWLDTSNTIQTSILITGGAWSPQMQLSAVGAAAAFPFVSSSAQGRSIAIWEEVGSPTSNIRFVLHDLVIPPVPPLPVTNLQGVTEGNRFLTKATFSQILTFGPSPSTDVVSYNIYAGPGLTNLLGTVPASGPLEFVIPCIFPNLAHTYAVVPVSSAGLLGTPTFVTIPPV